MYNKAIIVEARDMRGALALYKEIVTLNPNASTAYLRMASVYADRVMMGSPTKRDRRPSC